MNNSRWNFLIVLFVGFVDYLGIGLVYPIFAMLLFDPAQTLVAADASPEYRGFMLGILIGLTPISQFFCSPLLGAFSDLKGRKPALILGIGAGCLGYILAVIGILSCSLSLLFLYRILVGASDATAAVAQATLADISTEQNKAKRFAYLNACLGLGFTVGPFLGGILADSSIVSWFGYATPLILAGAMSLTNLILVLRKFPETRSNTETSSFDLIEGIHNIRKLFLMKQFQWLFFAGFALMFGWSFFNEFVPVLLRAKFTFTLSHIGEYYALTGAWYALGSYLATHVVHRYTPEKVCCFSLLFVALSCFGFLAVTSASGIWWIIPGMHIALAFAFPTATALVSSRAQADSQGEVLGVYQSVGAAAMGLSPLLVGGAVGAFPPLAALGGAFCMVLASCGFWMAKNRVLQTEGKSRFNVLRSKL